VRLRIPNLNEIKTVLSDAIFDFHKTDQYLLELDLNERTISNRFALHLQQRLPKWNVDCEYNRNLKEVKALELPKDGISWDDTQGKTVFPDIIVHQRGPGPNLLVIEMKKVGLSAKFDYQKLQAYKTDLQYEYACFIRISTGTSGHIEKPEGI
jgi:hypothetical protein